MDARDVSKRKKKSKKSKKTKSTDEAASAAAELEAVVAAHYCAKMNQLFYFRAM